MTDPRRWCTLLVEGARSAGASWAEAAVWETSTRVCAGRREPLRNPTLEHKVSLRVGTESGQVALVTGSPRSEGELSHLPAKAFASASHKSPDPADGSAERMELATIGLQISDPRLPRLEETDRRDIIAYNEDAVRGVSKGLTGVSFVYEEQLVRRAVLTSRGQEGLENGTRFRLRGALRHPSQPDAELSAMVESRRFADVSSMPLGTDLARRAVANASPANAPDRSLPVVIEPRVLATLLPLIASAFDGDLVAAGKSFSRSAELNATQTIGNSRLHVVDDATLPGALATRAFDDRGVPPMPLPLVREGTLGALYRSPRSARALGTRPTGHARWDGSAWPGNLVVRPGARSRNMMFPDVGRYVLIDDLLDLSGINLATGQIRGPVRLLLGELGKPIAGLGQGLLDTNIVELFSGLVELANDVERHGSVDASTMVFEGVKLIRA